MSCSRLRSHAVLPHSEVEECQKRQRIDGAFCGVHHDAVQVRKQKSTGDRDGGEWVGGKGWLVWRHGPRRSSSTAAEKSACPSAASAAASGNGTACSNGADFTRSRAPTSGAACAGRRALGWLGWD